LGAAYLAGLHAGVYKNLSDISTAWACERRYVPQYGGFSARQGLYDGWKKAIKKVLA
jgi:glycerol kinase